MRILNKFFRLATALLILLLFIGLTYFDIYGEEEEDTDKFISTLDFFKNSRYNRVEGFFIGYELESIPIAYPDFTFITRLGFGFEERRLGYGLKIQKMFGEDKKVSIFFNKETETNDYKIIGNTENTISALLAKKDFRDYFYLKRGGIEAEYYVSEKLNLNLSCDIRKYKPLYKRTDWSLFGEGEFRENPLVEPGNEFYVTVSVKSAFQESFFMPFNEWRYNIILEKGSDDFNYFGIGINVKRYQMIFESQRLVVNLYLHSRTKTTAEQHLIDLGGVSTLRGYGHKEFTGNRIFLFNLDYFFGRSILEKLPLSFIPFYDMLDLIFFFDAGKATIAGKEDNIFEGFGGGTENKIKSNIGIAFSLAQGFLRFNFARRLDRKRDNVTFSLRLMRTL